MPEPVVKGAAADALDGVARSDGDHLAQGADRLGMMGKFGQGIVDPAIEFGEVEYREVV